MRSVNFYNIRLITIWKSTRKQQGFWYSLFANSRGKGISTIIVLFIAINFGSAQKGESKLYFKNGDTITGIGKLKGAEFIKFKAEKGGRYEQISFKDLFKADITLKLKEKDTTISYSLFPIVKKNGEQKEPSVIGQYVRGKVNLYVKGEIKRIAYFHPNSGFGGTQDAVVHYFLRNDNEPDAVHIGSSFYKNETILENTRSIFSECPELFKKILAESKRETSIFEVISKYNHDCSQ